MLTQRSFDSIKVLRSKISQREALLREIQAMSDLAESINVEQNLQQLRKAYEPDMTVAQQNALSTQLKTKMEAALGRIHTMQRQVLALEEFKKNEGVFETERGNIEAEAAVGDDMDQRITKLELDIAIFSEELDTNIGQLIQLQNQLNEQLTSINQATEEAHKQAAEIIQSAAAEKNRMEELEKKRMAEEQEQKRLVEEKHISELRIALGHVTNAQSKLDQFFANEANNAVVRRDLNEIRTLFQGSATPNELEANVSKIKAGIQDTRSQLREEDVLNADGKIAIEERVKQLRDILQAIENANEAPKDKKSGYDEVFSQAKKILQRSESFNENLILLQGFCGLSDKEIEKIASSTRDAQTKKIEEEQSQKLQKFESYRQKIVALQIDINKLTEKIEAEEKEKHDYAHKDPITKLHDRIKEGRRAIQIGGKHPFTRKKEGDPRLTAKERRKNREGTLGTSQLGILQKRKEQSDLIKELNTKVKAFKREKDALKVLQNREVKSEVKEVVIHTASPDTVFAPFSAHLSEEKNKKAKLQFEKSLASGLEKNEITNKIVLKTGLIERIFDSIPDNILSTVFDFESGLILLNSISEINDPESKWLQKFLISDLVEKARETILTTEGKLRPELMVFLEKHYPQFSQQYDGLSSLEQEKMKRCLIFSLAFAGVAAIERMCMQEIAQSTDKPRQERYTEFKKSLLIPDLINHAMDSRKTHPLTQAGLFSQPSSPSPSSSSELGEAAARSRTPSPRKSGGGDPGSD